MKNKIKHRRDSEIRHKEVHNHQHRIRLGVKECRPIEVHELPTHSILYHEARLASLYRLKSHSILATMGLITGLSLRFALLYLTFLVLTSIYQATFPTSPHDKGEIVDHSAELLHVVFDDLRAHYPRFDDFVKETHQVVLQVLLFVTMR